VTIAGIRGILVVIVFMTLLVSGEIRGVTVDGQCPDLLIGEVTSVDNVQAPYALASVQLEKVKVSFLLKQIVESTNFQNGIENFEITILKNGPQEFVVGKTYMVGLNGKWFCSASKIE